MRRRALVWGALLACCLPALPAERHSPDFVASFTRLDIAAAEEQATAALRANPTNSLALFVRMEAAELQARTGVVLDSAVRLCRTSAPAPLQGIASARILRYAGNTAAFRAIRPRVQTTARLANACSLNLKLALVAAAADGDAAVDLDKAAITAGLLTRWQVAGPFGRFSNADFDLKWPPETDRHAQLTRSSPESEEFWFRDGLLTLPDYLSNPGVLYAGSEIRVARRELFSIAVVGAGTYSLFVDGRQALRHDARFLLQGAREIQETMLGPGRHRILLKFTADAAPLRVSVLPHSASSSRRQQAISDALKPYVQGLQAYMWDDLATVQQIARLNSSPLTTYLKALLYSEADGYSAEARSAWEGLPNVPLARLKLAAITSDPAQAANLDGPEYSDSEVARQLQFDLLHREASLKGLLAMHTSCSHLVQGIHFYNAGAKMEQAQKLEERLATCAPDSLDYARLLSAAGDHGRAADWLRLKLLLTPLNRSARRLLIEELLLNNQIDPARQEAQQLHRIAPNSERFARLALNPAQILDSRSGRANGFVQQNQFYAPYRRDGVQLVRDSLKRHLSGGPSVVLLSDKVIEYAKDGSVSVYIHRITRLLNKEGINRLGEAEIPQGADLLELRTIRASGETIEPELAHQKTTVSMPALEPEDSIEEEFVSHYTDEVPLDAGSFTFGSFTAPVLYSRFVVLHSDKTPVEIEERNAPPRGRHSGEDNPLIWEAENIQQSTSETSLPLGEVLPSIITRRKENRRARLRDDLIENTHEGLRVVEIAAGFRQQRQPSDYEQARQLYYFVTSKVDQTSDWRNSTAEDTLQNLEGSRTAALLALARAVGLKPSLVLARRTGRVCSGVTDFSCYTEPLVRFSLAGGVLDADAESDERPFGAVSPLVERQNALRVSFSMEDENQPVYVALAPKSNSGKLSEEKSLAEGDLVLETDGNLRATLHIQLGMARAQQVRSALRNANRRERQEFFEQLAARIFPGASRISGISAHEDDSEKPLELTIECVVPQFVNVQHHILDLDQLVPALGLRALYAKSAARKFPLYIDSVLFESTVFHLRLSPPFEVRGLPSEFTAHNEFGDYSVRFSSSQRQINVEREFHIPVQVIPPEKYGAFAQFARQIDEAERRRIAIRR